MFGFSFGSKKILGVDVGTSALKIVEVELKNDKPYLSNYAWMSIPDPGARNGKSNFIETGASEYLKKLIREAKINKADAYVAIPSFGGLIMLIDFPKMSREDMEQAIKFEAHKYIPTALDEVAIRWEILDEEPQMGNQLADDKNNPEPGSQEAVQVLLVAASKNKIAAYEKVVKDAGLHPKGVEIESISMVESLVGNDKGNFIIVDMGRWMCNIIYVEKGIIKANRNIDAGGDDITKAIATSFGIGRERAEAMKVSGKNFFSVDSKVQFPVLDMIVEEISRILEMSPGLGKDSHVDTIIISGGTSSLVGLKGFFQDRLKIQTIIGDPFSRLEYNKKLEKVLDGQKGRFAVCVGLALKGIRDIQESKK